MSARLPCLVTPCTQPDVRCRPRVEFTHQDDMKLCRYIADRIPELERGGRTGQRLYNELMYSAQTVRISSYDGSRLKLEHSILFHLRHFYYSCPSSSGLYATRLSHGASDTGTIREILITSLRRCTKKILRLRTVKDCSSSTGG